MDADRFDQLARALATGHSRRSLVKRIVGLGVVAATAAGSAGDVSARRRGSSASPTTTTPAPATTTTQPPCGGYSCGVDCCNTQLECCGGECCPNGSVCVGEEACCPLDLICDAPGTDCCQPGERCCSQSGGDACIPESGCCGDSDCTQFANSYCNNGICNCTPNSCDGNTCGDDGCGAVCECSGDRICISNGTCAIGCTSDQDCTTAAGPECQYCQSIVAENSELLVCMVSQFPDGTNNCSNDNNQCITGWVCQEDLISMCQFACLPV